MIQTSSVRAKNNFDVLRFFAASFVIVTHWYVLIGGKVEQDILMKIANNTIMLSTLGIKIFFIISGYLITKSLENSTSYLDYFTKRFLRIFPGLVAASLFCILVSSLFASVSLQQYFSNVRTWSFLFNILLLKLQWALPYVFENHPESTIMGSAWSLVYEVMMYFILALAGVIGLLKKRNLYLVSFFIIMIFYVFILSVSVPNKFRYYLIYTDLDLFHTINFMLLFQIGSLFYLFRDKIKYTNLYALLVLILWVISWYGGNIISNIGHILFIPYLVFWFAFNSKFTYTYNFGKYGDFSYGIYLYGMFVQQMLIAILGVDFSMYVMMPLSILISTVIAYFSWHWVEKPALELRKYIIPVVKR